jgi:hypothetical protein
MIELRRNGGQSQTVFSGRSRKWEQIDSDVPEAVVDRLLRPRGAFRAKNGVFGLEHFYIRWYCENPAHCFSLLAACAAGILR